MTGLENVNPNQFALPGMEKHAHPFAKHLTQGLVATYSEEGPKINRGGGVDHRHYIAVTKAGDLAPQKHTPHSSRPPLGELEWAGSKDTHAVYPGEIQWIGNDTGPVSGTERVKGLASSLYHLGNKVQFGQDTVPVHSPTRTKSGEAFSRKVGGPRPPADDTRWRPPDDTHPYEDWEYRNNRAAAEKMQGPKQSKGQLQLPGMERKRGRR